MCHLYSAELPPQCLVELQFRDRRSTQFHSVHQRIMSFFPLQVCRLVKLELRNCLELNVRRIQQRRKPHTLRKVGEPLRLPRTVSARLTYFIQYLPHCRRLRDVNCDLKIV